MVGGGVRFQVSIQPISLLPKEFEVGLDWVFDSLNSFSVDKFCVVAEDLWSPKIVREGVGV